MKMLQRMLRPARCSAQCIPRQSRRINGRFLRRNTLVVVYVLTAPVVAHAVDGCEVLLCLAAPSWKSIAQCVPPVRRLFRDLALGKPFPLCAMGGAENSASHRWSSAPLYCPPQYTRSDDGLDHRVYTCDFAGAISVTVNGELFAQTWWSMSGDSVTAFSPGAKAQLGSWDTRFDDEFAAWLASRPTPDAAIH